MQLLLTMLETAELEADVEAQPLEHAKQRTASTHTGRVVHLEDVCQTLSRRLTSKS
jgi:hypothetical protein